jgi:hypothetical protein
MRGRFLFVFFLVLFINCPSVLAGQVIGSITDPYDYGISEDTDIIESWVEKDGTSLTFVMLMRGTIRSAEELPDFNDTLNYVWHVDADNDYKTGQSPVGREFDVRAVISQDPNYAGGYVDVVGSMTGGGTGIVDVNDNVISVTIDRSQIWSVRRLHWSGNAWEDIGGSVNGNGITPMSGLARVGRYGVLFDPNSQDSEVGFGIYAFLETDPNNWVLYMSEYDNNQHNIFLSDGAKYCDANGCKILAQATSNAGPYNIRAFGRLSMNDSDPCAFGSGYSQAIFRREFVFDGNEGETGAIPPGVFFLAWSHDYQIFARDVVGQAEIRSLGSVSVIQPDPWERKAYLMHRETVSNKDVSNKYGQVVDLADYGLEFGETYQIDSFLSNNMNVPQATDNAETVCDASLLINVDAAAPRGDLDGDWDVDLFDFALLAGSWLEQW